MDIQVGKRYVIDAGVGEEFATVTGIVGPGLFEGEFYVEIEPSMFPGIVMREEFLRDA